VSQKKGVVRGRGIEREPLVVVHKIAETGGIHDGQAEADAVLLNIYVIVRLPYQTRMARTEDKPALMLSIATVLGFSALGGRGSFGW